METMALTWGFTFSICARCASITSRAETSFLCSRSLSSTADEKMISLDNGFPSLCARRCGIVEGAGWESCCPGVQCPESRVQRKALDPGPFAPSPSGEGGDAFVLSEWRRPGGLVF